MPKGLAFALLLILVVACGGDDRPDREEVILGATTSLRDSGLLAQLEPAFETRFPEHDLVVIAAGTGAAMANAQRGLTDLLVVHSPAREKAFVAAGHGLARRPLMESGFLLVGPPQDPAGIAGQSPVEALRLIADGAHRFISRGDDSGTHDRERALWRAADRLPRGEHYIESGRGMGATLTMASQMRAYTLVDSGTFANLLPRVELVALVENEAALANPYHVIPLPRERRKHAESRGADRFADWLLGEEARGIIQDFRINGRTVFRPGVSDR